MRLSFGSSEQREKEIKQEKRQGKVEDTSASFAQSPRAFIIELVKIVLIALAVIIPIRYFLFQPFYVRGASMEPSFHDSEYLIIDEITYRFTEPKRGEVVVVKNPDRHSEFFIKRIIGLPGETIELREGNVYIYNNQNIDGFMIRESYLAEGTKTSGEITIQLGEEEYYVLGDNRTVSLDSRIFGPLNREYIVGRAWLRVWPFDEFQHFTVPAYNQ
ncbi:MAG: signal peptidase I [Patescibacteria group bacterium]|nr:signal peptidase I [Patescibacteria group bacterium]MDD5715714.1 signal peptidase I [Patescibacteria group bacterium]